MPKKHRGRPRGSIQAQHSSIASHGHSSLSLIPSSATTSPLNRGSRPHRALQSTSATRNTVAITILHSAHVSNDASYSVESGITSTVNRKETHPVPNARDQTVQEHTDRQRRAKVGKFASAMHPLTFAAPTSRTLHHLYLFPSMVARCTSAQIAPPQLCNLPAVTSETRCPP
jgi:hypothetical protein